MKSSSLLKTIAIIPALELLTAVNVSALTYQDSAEIQFTFNPTISVSLSSPDLIISNLTPGSASDSNIVTATVSTNAGWGYYLAATAGTAGGTTNLVNTTDNAAVFTSLASNVATLSTMPDNSWGYSYSTDNGTTWVSGNSGSTTAGYNGLPLDADDNGATGIKLLSSNTLAASGSVQFKIGAHAGTTQAAGTYTGTVNFYAVTNPAPMGFDDAYAAAGKTKLNGYYQMQDATSAICTAVDEGQVGQVIDARDNTVYHIGKLADGKCWMLDNLALDPTDSTTAANMNASNTNATAEAITNLLHGGGSTTGWSNTAVADVDTGFETGGYIVPRINNVSKDTLVTSYGPASSHGQAKEGIHYNYCAASASTYCYGVNSGVDVSDTLIDVSQDICPRGWRMPTGGDTGEYYALTQRYNSTATDTNSLQYNLSTPLSGTYGRLSAIGQGSYGFWWSSTYYGSYNMYELVVYPTNVYQSGGDRCGGESMRCLVAE